MNKLRIEIQANEKATERQWRRLRRRYWKACREAEEGKQMSEVKVTYGAHVQDMPYKKQSKPEKGDMIHITDERYGVSVRALVDDISEDGTRMTLSKLKEDE